MATILGVKRQKRTPGDSIIDDLPDHLNYHGNPPKQNSQEPWIFSTPVIPLYSRQLNYDHLIYHADDDNHWCIKCNQKIATGGKNDPSNSVKHIVVNHPEVSVWQMF